MDANLGVMTVRRQSRRKASPITRKILSWILFVVGIACIVFGLVSCHHYYVVNPPPEAYQPGWDGEAQAYPYIAFERFFYIMAGGVLSLSLGFYLRGKVRKIHS